MVYLFNIELQNWGDMTGLLIMTVDRMKAVLGDFLKIDWNGWYFIFTGGLIEKGRRHTPMRWRQEDPEPNAEPNMVDITTPQMTKAEIYYSACDQIDRPNRCWQ